MRIVIATAFLFSFLVVPQSVEAQANAKLADEDGEACHVCGSARDGGLLDKQYCKDLSSEIEETYVMKDEYCTTMQYAWSKTCCEVEISFEDNLPDPGTYAICDVCPGGEYPLINYQMVNFLYTGLGSCVQYWEAGKRGQLQDSTCDAYQFFM